MMANSIKHITSSIAAKLVAAMLVCVLSVSFASKFHYHDLSGTVHSCIHLSSDFDGHSCTDSHDCGHSHNEHDNCSLHILSWFVDESNSGHHHCSSHHQSFCHDCAVVSTEIALPVCYLTEYECLFDFQSADYTSIAVSYSHLRAPPALSC